LGCDLGERRAFVIDDVRRMPENDVFDHLVPIERRQQGPERVTHVRPCPVLSLSEIELELVDERPEQSVFDSEKFGDDHWVPPSNQRNGITTLMRIVARAPARDYGNKGE
jgi:hypothetical protein